MCGQCFINCPQSAKEIRNDISAARAILKSGAPVYASLAPSVLAGPERSIEAIEHALCRLGFSGAEETAAGATIVKRSYEAMVNETLAGEAGSGVIISSCCHSVNSLIQKHYQQALPYLAKVLSPMLAHGADIKRRVPSAKVIFIGPCISKKEEAELYPGYVDCVLTFEELKQWMEAEGVEVSPRPQKAAGGRTRLFPIPGGIIKSMEVNREFDYIAVDGIDKCISALEDIIKGELNNCFVEMSSCSGGCINGPGIAHGGQLIRDHISIVKSAPGEDFLIPQPAERYLVKAMPALDITQEGFSEEAMRKILRKMGKITPEDELNCGSCGYETCRKKAEAVLRGKAEVTMCLPYLMAKAESFSDGIVTYAPYGIVALSRKLKIQQMNSAAKEIFELGGDENVNGMTMETYMNPGIFKEVLQSGQNIYEKELYLDRYDKYITLTAIADVSYNSVTGIMRDVTGLVKVRSERRQISRDTIDIADRVIEKQMRTAQEIASLLGETTAETQVALTKLKELLRDE